MICKFKFFASIREAAGERETTLHFDEPITIWEALQRLAAKYGDAFRRELFRGEEIADDYLILVNGVHIGRLGGEKTVLNDGDEVAILPPVGGG